MNPEVAAILTLAGYALIAAGLIVRSIRRCEDGPLVWFLYATQRLYSGLWFHWRATNHPCPFPSTGGALIIANHRSPVDPMMIWSNHHWRRDRRNVRVIGFLTAAEYCRVRGLVWLVNAMQSIPVQRNGNDVGPAREAIRRLKDGRLVGLFPEGGLCWGVDLREPNTGVAFIALKARVPVIPVFIRGVLQDQASMVTPFLHRSRVIVTYGQPVDLTRFYERKVTPELLIEVTNLLMSHLAALGNVGFTPARLPVQDIADSTADSTGGQVSMISVPVAGGGSTAAPQ